MADDPPTNVDREAREKRPQPVHRPSFVLVGFIAAHFALLIAALEVAQDAQPNALQVVLAAVAIGLPASALALFLQVGNDTPEIAGPNRSTSDKARKTAGLVGFGSLNLAIGAALAHLQTWAAWAYTGAVVVAFVVGGVLDSDE